MKVASLQKKVCFAPHNGKITRCHGKTFLICVNIKLGAPPPTPPGFPGVRWHRGILKIVFAKDIILYPKFETEPVFTSGDAADDPAFWYNQVNPEQSIVFGTDKKAGIHAFALNGARIKFIPSGKINNIDITLICEKPKISRYKNKFKKNISTLLNIKSQDVNVKATTTEKLGFLGREEGIACQSIVTISKK